MQYDNKYVFLSPSLSFLWIVKPREFYDSLPFKNVLWLWQTNLNKILTVCSPGSPLEFIPAMRTTVDLDGKIVVTIHCISEASPKAVVSWFRGSEAVTSGTVYQISSNTTRLKIRDYNISNFLLQNYTCTCRNPLGSQIGQIQLQGKGSQVLVICLIVLTLCSFQSSVVLLMLWL